MLNDDSTHPIGNPPPYASVPPPVGPPGLYGPPVMQATVLPIMPHVFVSQRMSPNPTSTTCRSCHQDIVTRVEVRPTMRTHLFAALLCVFGCWPCVCIPYCMESCMNADHFCPNCGAFIGSYMN